MLKQIDKKIVRVFHNAVYLISHFQFYDDPDNTTMVLPTHGGPLPKPPGVKPVPSSSKLEAPPRRKKQSLPEPPKPAEPEIEVANSKHETVWASS